MSKPYFEKKNVILCRSGVQLYRRNELLGLNLGSEPKEEKEVYAVYRPKEVIIKVLDKCKMLPITKEHPPEFINGDNWNSYAEGYTGENVTVVDLDDGEIGLESSLVFSTRRIYDHYKRNNKMVSLGYECTSKWVEGKDWDIELVSIDEVNHLAVTALGRGGETVAILDSMKEFFSTVNSGIFHYAVQGVQDSSADFIGSFASFVEADDVGKVKDSLYSVCLMSDSVERKTLFTNMLQYVESKDAGLVQNMKTLYTIVDTQTNNLFCSAMR